MSDEGELLLTQNSLDKFKARWATPEGVEAREQFRAAVLTLIEPDAHTDPGHAATELRDAPVQGRV